MNAPLRALVIDDDVAIRVLVTRILERRDFHVDTARDGAEGIEKLAGAADQLAFRPAHFLEKPFDVETFVREVSDCLQHSPPPSGG